MCGGPRTVSKGWGGECNAPCPVSGPVVASSAHLRHVTRVARRYEYDNRVFTQLNGRRAFYDGTGYTVEFDPDQGLQAWSALVDDLEVRRRHAAPPPTSRRSVIICHFVPSGGLLRSLRDGRLAVLDGVQPAFEYVHRHELRASERAPGLAPRPRITSRCMCAPCVPYFVRAAA